MLDSILSDLERYLNLKAIKAGTDMPGYYLLRIPEKSEVWVKELNPGFYMKSTVCTVGQLNEDGLIYLMKANFLGQGTGGGILSLDPEEKFLILSYCINYEVNYKLFRDRLEDFVNYLEFWRSEIKKIETRQV